MHDGAHLDQSRTAHADRARRDLRRARRVATTLGPDGLNKDGAVSDLLANSAENLDGKGAEIRREHRGPVQAEPRPSTAPRTSSSPRSSRSSASCRRSRPTTPACAASTPASPASREVLAGEGDDLQAGRARAGRGAAVRSRPTSPRTARACARTSTDSATSPSTLAEQRKNLRQDPRAGAEGAVEPGHGLQPDHRHARRPRHRSRDPATGQLLPFSPQPALRRGLLRAASEQNAEVHGRLLRRGRASSRWLGRPGATPSSAAPGSAGDSAPPASSSTRAIALRPDGGGVMSTSGPDRRSRARGGLARRSCSGCVSERRRRAPARRRRPRRRPVHGRDRVRRRARPRPAERGQGQRRLGRPGHQGRARRLEGPGHREGQRRRRPARPGDRLDPPDLDPGREVRLARTAREGGGERPARRRRPHPARAHRQRPRDRDRSSASLSLVLNGGALGKAQVISRELNTALDGRESDMRTLVRRLDEFVEVGGRLARTTSSRPSSRSTAWRGPRTTRSRRSTPPSTTCPARCRPSTQQRANLVKMLDALSELGTVGSDVIIKSKDRGHRRPAGARAGAGQPRRRPATR